MRRSSPRTTFTNVVPKVSLANVPLLVRRRVTTPTAPVETKVQFVTEKRSTSVMLSAGCPPTEWPAQSSVTSCVSWTSRHVPDEDRSAVKEAATLSAAVIVNEHAPRPLQAPLQPAKSKPSSGVAASCNELPASNTAEQVPGHETPGGVEVT